MAVAFIKGMQGDDPKYLKTVSTIKHFAANNSEFNRHRGSSDMDERDLREYYLAAFKAGVVEGHVQSLMGAYNSLNGVPCCANHTLMTDILRTEWGFDGFTVSDCGAIDDIYAGHHYAHSSDEAAAMGVKAGTDINCGGTYQRALKAALEQNLLTEADIDQALFRAFRARFRLGEFDPDSLVKYRSIPASELDSAANRDLALLAAEKAIVLLKNDKNILPLDAKSVTDRGHRAQRQPGDLRRLFRNAVLLGEPARGDPRPVQGATGRVRDHRGGGFNGQSGVQTEDCREGGQDRRLHQQGRLGEVRQARFRRRLPEPRRARLEPVDGRQDRVPARRPHRPENRRRRRGADRQLAAVGHPHRSCGSGDRVHDLYLSFSGEGGGYLLNVNWLQFAPQNQNYRAAAAAGGVRVDYAAGCAVRGADESGIPVCAAALAKGADVAVVVVGTDLSISNEDRDRSDINLPGVQEKLVQAVFQANPRTVVVLVNGPRLAINWTQANVPGILCAWYDGECQGTAISNVLFGDYNPGGRLTTTWYKDLEGIPSIDQYSLRDGNRTYWYFSGEPLYPFGYGLSYTAFAYSGLKLSQASAAAGAKVQVSLTLANTGARDGEEVVQLYVHNNDPAEKLPQKKLVGFKRVALKAGAKTTVVIPLTVDGETLGYWDAKAHAFRLNPAVIDLMVGSSSQDIRLKGQLQVTGPKK